MTEEEYRKSVEDSQKAAHEENMWGKPARDIITGISNNTNVRPVRAIWELVQNARDVVKPGCRAKILFKRENNAFVFQHDGTPFTHKTIEALILQTSSKATENNAEVGQYGTGFLTTHKFGLKFRLKAPLLTSEKSGRYCVIPDFEIDRSTTDKDEMRRLIEEQWKETKKWGVNFLDTTESPFEYTIFRYLHENERERQNAAEAFRDALAMTPYVLLLNPQVERIAFVDDTERWSMVYEMPSERGEVVEELPGGVIKKNTITIHRVGKEKESKTIFYIESKELTEKDSRVPKAMVILPVEEDADGGLRVEPPVDDIPQIYIFLPLLGTEDWGFNFMFHSSLFTCDRDSRDSLRLVGNGQNNDDQAARNREIIDLVNRLIGQFIEKKTTVLKDAKYLVQVNFKTQQANEELGTYYKGLQEYWRSKYETLSVVDTVEGEGLDDVKSVKVLDESLYKDCEKNAELLTAIYQLLGRTKAWKVPVREDMIYWSRTIDDWYRGEDNPHQLRIDDLVRDVQDLNVAEADLEWLHTICKYIIDIKRDDLFKQFKLIPNDQLQLQYRDQLTRTVGMAQVVRLALDVMVPEEVKNFVHGRFEDVVGDNLFDHKRIKECITTFLNNHNSEQNNCRSEVMRLKKVNMESPGTQKAFDGQRYEDRLYSGKAVQCILNLLKAVLPEETNSVGGKLIDSFEEFYGITATAPEGRLDKRYELDERAFYNALIYDSLFRFTLADDKAEKADWIKAMVKKVYDNSDSRSYLSNYQVYPDQKGVFKYAEWLKKQPDDTPDRALEIYDEIKNAGTKRSVKDELVSKEYNLFFQGDGEFKSIDHCREIEDELLRKGYNLNGYEHKGLIVEIIKHLTTAGDECEQWKKLFAEIEKNKGQLMFSTLVEQTKKDSLFSLIQIEDEERLKLVAELAKEPKLVQIYEEGKKAVAALEREENDKAFKLRLGKYVEEILRRELNVQLGGKSLTVGPVKDVQNGQDMVVCVDDEIVYYIEVKSRWSTDKSVLMSTQQHKTSCREKSHYALCVVDMVDMSKEDAIAHIYPEFEKVEERVKVLTNIGILNERLKDATDDIERQVHVSSGYQVLVSQRVIEDNKKDFREFVEMLREVVVEKICQG